MDMSHDTFAPAGIVPDDTPCWSVLRARFRAGIEARSALHAAIPAESALVGIAGSFHRRSALVLRCNEYGLDVVNPDLSDSGKADSDTLGLAAGNMSPGGRG